MKEINRLLDQLRRAYDGDAWSGPSLQATLAGLTVAQAVAHPLAGAHSIWEIVLHLYTWLETVRRRLETNTLLGPTDEENWPLVPAEPTEAAWQHAQQQLRQAHERLLDAISGMHDADLDLFLAPLPEYSAGTPGSYYVLLHGLVQHNQYHTGQIALLRKAFA
ncbi:DinB family protein [Hymenobacter wooponensis]|uniref:DinB family protein n=1 Tax=Hymenobacter wooponensis TaxID=1525360 RepID=A0A4Z0MPG3_9BACT|nr:DinB family protein [Hymenobacter wooponensis]TGD81330.1 DinB family protein [Hymenobacter wooponensis]